MLRPYPCRLRPCLFMRVGLIGFPVAHSKSPLMQNAAFQTTGLPWTYALWNTPHEQVAERVAMIRADDEIAGANVTVPHKLNVMPHLDHISEHARAIGAVNTICKVPAQGLPAQTGVSLLGDNTDWIGFLHDLEWNGVKLDAPANALVLGAGGSARGIVYGLLRRNWHVTLVNRNVARAQVLATDMQRVFASQDAIRVEAQLGNRTMGEPTLIVNCTSAGMEPNDTTSPWLAEVPFPSSATLYDLVYKPRVTTLMREAEAAGARVIGGIGMLAEQGAAAFEMWTGVPAHKVSQVMRDILN